MLDTFILENKKGQFSSPLKHIKDKYIEHNITLNVTKQP